MLDEMQARREQAGEGQVQGHESGVQGCAHKAVGACRAPCKNHSVAVSLMEDGCEDHWPGAPWSTGLLPVHQGLAVAGPSSGGVHEEIQGEPPGILWGWVRREGCGDSCECVLARPGVNTGSVVLKEREQVITAVGGEVGWTQVGEQFIRIGQFWEQIQSWFGGLPCPSHTGRPHHACGRIEGQFADGPCVCLAQGLPGWRGRIWMV